jgi:E3 ubiquitin-protein ligase MARCH6
MWFIKDPQDQNSHPIRDILDRPTMIQLRKIVVSAIMYALVVFCVVATVAGLASLGKGWIIPLRWKNRYINTSAHFLTQLLKQVYSEPLSDVPVDLTFLHLLLPYTMHYFRPVKFLKKAAEYTWRYLAAHLRLTSYMFGGRHDSEEYSSEWRPWSQILRSSGTKHTSRIRDGNFRRVPATDHIALPREMRATARVTEDGSPFDEDARATIEAQNAEAEKAKRIVKDDYTVVHLPPNFRERLIVLIISLWLIGAGFLGLLFSAPILLGRAVFTLTLGREVHDGYSLIVGFYLLWSCYVFGKAVDRMDKRRQRRGGDGPRGDLPIYVFKRGVLWCIKITYMIIFLGVVVPTLIATVVELYLLLPIRYALDPSITPRLRIADMWCLGILYSKIALHASHLQPPSPIVLGVRTVIILFIRSCIGAKRFVADC